jgi:trehalose 6-phosphate synthase/phosphatase
MPKEERRWRMLALRARVQAHTVHDWADGFVRALSNPSSAPAPIPPDMSSRMEIRALLEALVQAPGRVVVLDYDGTLVPLQPRPEMAGPSPRLKWLLLRLSQLPHTQVHVVSGRPRASLAGWLEELPIGLHAEHGLWSRWDPEGPWEVLQQGVTPPWMGAVREQLQKKVEEIPGSWVEEKTASLGWHYRAADPQRVQGALAELVPRLRERVTPLGGELLPGNALLEVRPVGVNKGRILPRAVQEAGANWVVLAAGDDTTDEDLFRALPPTGIGLHVGPSASLARYRLAAPEALILLLEEMARRVENKAPEADEVRV